ncbi:class I adenylate-forming enzyme family protein [Virgibacillus ainsalahensis]
MLTNKRVLSVANLLEKQVERYGDKELISDQKERLSYREFGDKVNRLAGGLLKLGIQKGDRIGVCLPNWHEMAVIFFASAKIGATVVPFNPMYRSQEIEYILKNSEPKALFISQTFKDNVGIDLAVSLVKDVISVRFNHEAIRTLDELDRNPPVENVDVSINVDEDLFCILYTSGTTGLPKGVMTSHRSIVHCANTVAKGMRCTEDDVFIVPAPLFHIFGITCNLATAIASGARIVLMEKFHPEKVLQLIEQEKVTIHQGVPTMFLKELEQENFSQYDLSTLRTGMVGAAPITPYQMKKIREEMGVNLCQSFGITETGSLTLTGYDDDEDIICSTLGQPIDGVQIKIVDENREALVNGEVGEIAVQSVGTMKGYYKMPEQTNMVLDERNFYYTGDLGKLDEKGNLHFIGRQKEMIIRGGFNIYPQEIEELLKKHPKISETAVVGLPDEVLGEVVFAAVHLKSGMQSDEEEMKDYITEHMAKYKVPKGIVFVDAFPVTASGKIQKAKLKKQLQQKLEQNI